MVWLDLVMLGVLALSVLVGLWRGLVFEVLSVLGWLVAYFAMPYVAPLIQPWLPLERLGESLAHMLSLGLAFLLVLLVWGLSAKLLRALIHATPLSFVDRLGGAGFGLLRGLLICVAVVTVLGMTPFVQSPAWRQSQLVPHGQTVLQWLRPALPEPVMKLIPA
ncbi:membrane protein required for colicin V production [Paucibacter oligotrophus]|uniref:Membrane protein required for colicin V production n=1 Tax=Roseateles oligotrophus TaxID=1769250 RepID=A0A840L699_9BURK|nr:CvpA family protein [Roseateles oligotrophus]MBB4844094.1 membrane protein required for colicin V production [Roseateles oligotrophus]